MLAFSKVLQFFGEFAQPPLACRYGRRAHLLVFAAPRAIDRNSAHVLRYAIVTDYRAAKEDNPMGFAAGECESGLDPHRTWTIAKFRKSGSDVLALAWVYSRQQMPKQVAARIGIQTEIAEHLLGPAHAVGSKIPIPSAYLPRFQGCLDVELREAGLVDGQLGRSISDLQF